MRLAAAFLTYIVLSLPAGAGAQPNEGIGFGTMTCGQFGVQYAQMPEIAEGLFYSWAAGLLSGINIARRLQGKGLMNLSPPVSAWRNR